MTILNTIVLPDRVGFLADSSVSGDPAGPTITAKVVALPGLGLIVGAAGSLAVLQEAVRLLLGGLPPGSTVADVAVCAGPALAELWQRTQRAPTSVVLAGMVGDEAQAYILSTPTFPAVQMPPGVWLLPPTRPIAARTTVDVGEVTDPSPGGEPGAPPVLRQPAPWSFGWSESLEVALAEVQTQRAQRRVQSGGSLELLTVAAHGIGAHRIRDLEFLDVLP